MRGLEDLLDRLRGQVDTEEDRALVEAITADLADLGARALGGEDVTGELAHVRAQAANLTAGKAAMLAGELRLFFTQLVAELVSAALRT